MSLKANKKKGEKGAVCEHLKVETIKFSSLFFPFSRHEIMVRKVFFAASSQSESTA
jgi:hypothetical protein